MPRTPVALRAVPVNVMVLTPTRSGCTTDTTFTVKQCRDGVASRSLLS